MKKSNMAHSLLTAAKTPSVAIQRVVKGLPWSDAEFVAEQIGVTLDRLADLVGIPRSTFYRRRGGVFSLPESEHVMRFARLWNVALDVFVAEDAARSWLGRPQHGLDGGVPLEYAKTELGAREVEDLMRRIQFGLLA